MEIALREDVANATDEPDVKEMLNDSRFVDDLIKIGNPALQLRLIT